MAALNKAAAILSNGGWRGDHRRMISMTGGTVLILPQNSTTEHNGDFVHASKNRRAYFKKWRAEHHEERLAYDRKYRVGHREQHRKAVKKYQTTHREQRNECRRKYRVRHPEKTRAQKLARRFGITIEEYDAMLVAQNGICAICGSSPNGRNLCVDHNHETGKVRGLLCDKCNTILGRICESTDILLKMSDYLKQR